MLTDADPVLLAVAVAFAVLTGANDGGTLLSLSLKTAGLRVGVAMLVLSAMVAVVPAVLGTEVATTLATRLVASDDRGALVMLAAVVAAVVVTLGLSRGGLPTSLTLALIGGLIGAGMATGGPVAWDAAVMVLVVAAAAPAAGAGMAFMLSRLAGRIRIAGGAGRFLARAHRATFAVQAVAYGANDGQKMLAVGAVALGLAGGQPGGSPASGSVAAAVVPAWPLLAGCATAFLVGAAIGLRRYARTVGAIIPLRPPNTVAGEAAASIAVLASAAAGAPVSMTQAVAGGLVGTGVSEGQGRVRWQVATRIVVAWVVTLPAAVAAGAVGGAAATAAGLTGL